MSKKEEEEDTDKLSSLLSEVHLIQPLEQDNNSDQNNILPSNKLASETTADLENELARFRSDWKKDLQVTQNKLEKNQNNEGEISNSLPKNAAVYHEFPKRNTPKNEVDSEGSENVILNDNVCEYEQPENNEDKAKYLFNKGVLLEQQNRHYEAIKFYRMALQIDADIEYKACNVDVPKRKDQKSTEIDTKNVENGTKKDDPDKEKTLYEQFRDLILLENSLCMRNFPQSTTHISDIPIEVLIVILKWVISDQLDMRSLENFSLVCKGFYVCSNDPELWKLICSKIWGRGILLDPKYISWQDMHKKRPRLNFDGAYISKTSYVRSGEQGLDNLYKPWHLVEYYRYLRFFTDKTVIFLTCADEPKNIVTKLNIPKNSGDQNILKGQWNLSGSSIFINIKTKTLSNKPGKYSRKNQGSSKEVIDKEQYFKIELEINSESRSKNNQLKWLSYELDILYKNLSKKVHSKLDLNKVDFPLFYFSRVKSYSKITDLPLN